MPEPTEKIKRQNCQIELSESTRTAIINKLRDGDSAIKIANDLGIARSTVYRTKDRFQEHGDMSSRTRSGRPHKLNDYAKRYVGRMARKGDRPNWAAIAATIDGGISRSALRRVVRRQEAQRTSQVKDSKKSSKKATSVEKDTKTSN